MKTMGDKKLDNTNNSLLSTPLPISASTATKRNFRQRSSVNYPTYEDFISPAKGINENLINQFDKINPSEGQSGIRQPLNRPNADHVDFREALENFKRESTDKSVSIESGKNTSQAAKPLDMFCRTRQSFSGSNNEISDVGKDFEFLVPAHPSVKTKPNKVEDNYFLEQCSKSNQSRTSTAGSDSSLGIISTTDLESVRDGEIIPLTQKEKMNLSQRLAEQLSMSTYGGLDELDASIFNASQARLKESSRYNGNKENNTFLESITTPTLHYRKTGDLYPLTKEYLASSTKPLRERNSMSSFKTLPSTMSSDLRNDATLNPFGDESQISIGSEEFQSGGAEKLLADQASFSNSLQSLSGFLEGNISIGTEHEKMSIGTYMRTGSGPLGILGDETEHGTPRPNFGRPINSPKKKSAPRPILPEPAENLTFLMDELPTRDTDDISVPSLSRIGAALYELRESTSPREFIDRLMGGQRNKMKPTRQKTATPVRLEQKLDNYVPLTIAGKNETSRTSQPQFVGRNSFCRKRETKSTRFSSSIGSNLSLDLDAPKFDEFVNDELEYVCVLTPESLEFDIFNEFSRDQHYTLSKACYVDREKNNAAALVHIPSTEIDLKPGETKTISVIVAALAEGMITISITVVRCDSLTQETEENIVCRKMCAEIPKISILNPPSVELLQLGTYQHLYQGKVILKNNGYSSVPLTLYFDEAKEAHENMFYFNENQGNKLNITLNPGESLNQAVQLAIPPVFHHETNPQVLSQPQINVTAQLKVMLSSSVKAYSPQILSISLQAKALPNFFSAPSFLSVPLSSSATFYLYNSGEKPAFLGVAVNGNFKLNTGIKLTLPPGEAVPIIVTHCAFERSYPDDKTKDFDPEFKEYLSQLENKEWLNSEGTIIFCLLETYQSFHVTLNAMSPRSSTNSTLATPTPQSSRSTSPTSPSVQSKTAMRLVCTHRELVWGGCPLHQRLVKIFSIKNSSFHREKIRLKIVDLSNSFKILDDKGQLESELKLGLQPMESQQVKVVAVVGTKGAKKAHITICRINSPVYKKVLPLFAYGGKARLNIEEGVFQDPSQQMWLFLDPDSLSAIFRVTNVGDGPAFMRLDEISTSAGRQVNICPPEHFLQPSEQISVRIALSISTEHIEHLLAKSTEDWLRVAKVRVSHGDESSRLRLKRLSIAEPRLAERLRQLGLAADQSLVPGLPEMEQELVCADILWMDDIKEWTIGVLARRSSLEAVQLDTTVEFVDLSSTLVNPS